MYVDLTDANIIQQNRLDLTLRVVTTGKGRKGLGYILTLCWHVAWDVPQNVNQDVMSVYYCASIMATQEVYLVHSLFRFTAV